MDYTFTAAVWEYGGQASWHFVSLPKSISDEIKLITSDQSKRGFGSVRVHASVGKTAWDSSIFPDKKSGCYVLPLKKSVRKAENLAVDSEAVFVLQVSPGLR